MGKQRSRQREQDRAGVLYSEVSKYVDIGTEEKFREAMLSPDRRKTFYDEVSKYVDIGSFDYFEEAVKKKDLSISSYPVSQESLQETGGQSQLLDEVASLEPVDASQDFGEIQAEQANQELLQTLEQAEGQEGSSQETDPINTLRKSAWNVLSNQIPSTAGAFAATYNQLRSGSQEISRARNPAAGFMPPGVSLPMEEPLSDEEVQMRKKASIENITKPLLEFAKQQQEEGIVYTEDLINTIDKIESPLDFLNWTANALGQASAQIPLSIATRGTSSLVQETGEIYLSSVEAIAREQGITMEEVIERGLDEPAIALSFGTAAGALEFLGAKGVGGQIFKGNARKELIKEIRDRGISIVKSGLWEGGTEFVQTIIEQLGVKRSEGKSYSEAVKNLEWEDIIESTAQGAVGGGGLTSVGQITKAVTERSTKEETKDEQPKIQEEAPREDPQPTETIEKSQTKEVQPEKTKEESKETGDSPIFDVEKIKSGKTVKRRSTIEPELSEEGKLHEELSIPKTKAHAKELVENNDRETIEKLVRKGNDAGVEMPLRLRNETANELRKSYLRDAMAEEDSEVRSQLFSKVSETADYIAEMKGDQAGGLATSWRDDPETATVEFVDRAVRENKKVLETKTEKGTTLQKEISNAQKQIDKIAKERGVKLEKDETLDVAIQKVLAEGEIRKARKTKISDIRKERKSLLKQLKDSGKQKPDQPQAQGGLFSDEQVVIAAKLALNIAKEGAVKIEEVIDRVKKLIKETMGITPTQEDVDRITKQFNKDQAIDKLASRVKKKLAPKKDKAKPQTTEEIISSLKEEGLDDQAINDLIAESTKIDSDQVAEVIESLIKKKSPELSDAKVKRRAKGPIKKVLEKLVSGDVDVKEAVSDQFGLVDINNEDITALTTIAEKVNLVEGKEAKVRAMDQFFESLNAMDKNKRL